MAGANVDTLDHAGHGAGDGNAADIGNDGRGSGDALQRGGRAASVIGQLREQTEAARALVEQMRDLVGDDEEMVATAVEGETDIHEAIGAAFARLAELKALKHAISDMMTSLEARGSRFDKQGKMIREAIRIAMETADIRRKEYPLGTISLRAVAPEAEITDESAIPSRFWKAQEPKLDRKAVLDALKAKVEVPGAMLSNGSQTIAVKFS